MAFNKLWVYSLLIAKGSSLIHNIAQCMFLFLSLFLKTFTFFVYTVRNIIAKNQNNHNFTDEEGFQRHIQKYNLSFNEREFDFRLNIYAETDDDITTHNSKGDSSYTLGHNRFSHLSWNEFRELMHLDHGYIQKPKVETKKTHFAIDFPVPATSVDWNAAGRVTPVKDQVKNKIK
jgi:hypothetical protein